MGTMYGSKSTKKRKPYRIKTSNKGENENTGVGSNPSGAGKEMEGNAHTYRDPKSQFPKNKDYVGKSGTMTY